MQGRCLRKKKSSMHDTRRWQLADRDESGGCRSQQVQQPRSPLDSAVLGPTFHTRHHTQRSTHCLTQRQLANLDSEKRTITQGIANEQHGLTEFPSARSVARIPADSLADEANVL